MQVILVNPQIPQNTGTIVRLCAVTGCRLILVPPLGFSIEDKDLKRAGLDYWEGVEVIVTEQWQDYLGEEPYYFFSSHAKTYYTEVAYTAHCSLIFGAETTGLPAAWRERWPNQFLKIPMVPNKRCLNLANSASIVIYEAWRQLGFKGAG